MTGRDTVAQGGLGGFGELAAKWVERVCALLADNPPTRAGWTVTGLTDTGFQARADQVVLDVDAVALASIRLEEAHPELDALAEFAAKRADLFRPPSQDATTPMAARRIWAWGTVAAPLLRSYLRRAGDLHFDGSLFDGVVEEAERNLRGELRRTVVYAPIANLRVTSAESIEIVPGITLRAATPFDIASWLDRETNKGDSTAMEPRAVLEASFEESPDDARSNRGTNQTRELITRLATAIQLELDCDAYAKYVRFETDAVFDFPLAGTGTYSPGARRGRTVGDLDATAAPRVRELATALQTSPNAKACAIALRRWDDVCANNRPEDQIVDSWVGLESLLFGKGSGELIYRASLRLAFLIGLDAAERVGLLKAAKDSYDARSKVVHGVDTTRLDLPRLAVEARGYLRRALISVLERRIKFSPEEIEANLLRLS